MDDFDPRPPATRDAAFSAQLRSPILTTVARFAVPLTLFVSLIIFFQGHNKPGGGFIAGVLAAAAGAVALLGFGLHRSLTFSWWYIPALALLILPSSGPSAVVIALVIGTFFWLSARGKTFAEYRWWKMGCLGLTISLMTGVVPLLLGRPFMDHTVWHFHLPLWGEDHLPTATFFDIGVYLIDVGTLLTIFVELGLEEE